MPDTPPPSNSINEAARRIADWQSQNPPEIPTPAPLDLSGIGLTNEDLKTLIKWLAKNVSHFKILLLNDNRLTKLPKEIGMLRNLGVLAAHNNQLTELPPEIKKLNKLLILKINNNQLTELPPEIGQLNLVQLEADNNRLIGLPLEIGLLKNLETLGINNNQITELPLEIGRLSKLENLGVQYNKLTKFPSTIGQLRNLQVLVANNNRIAELPAQIGLLTALAMMEVSNNQITELPSEIGGLSNLEQLGLENNRLLLFPPEIGQLLNLEALIANKNQLTELPLQIGQLKSLALFEAGDNQIKALPITIEQLDNLQKLGLNNNRLTQLPSQIKGLMQLLILELNNNQLTKLPPEIGQLDNLQTLGINNNQLTELTKQIGKLSNLQDLGIDNNRLSKLPQEIAALTNLKLLLAKNNLLTDVPQEIEQMRNLTRLQVARNPLSAESLTLLRNSFPEGGPTTVDTESESIEVLKTLYPQESSEEIFQKDLQIGSLYREEPNFTDGNDNNQDTLKGNEIVDTFLSRVKTDHGGLDVTNHYHDAARYLLNRALGTDISDSEAALIQVASSLGNCPTPVSDLLEKTGVQMAIESQKEISTTLKSMLHRQAFETLIKKERIIPFSLEERIEALQGLTNALFLEAAETDPSNSLKIIGERPHIASKTENIDFAFQQVTEAMRDKFAKICCKTNDASNTPIRDEQGKYQLDPDKYYTVTQKYVENQGILDPKAQARKKHIHELKKLIAKPDNKDLSVDLDLVDFEKIEDDLRLAMKTTPEDQIDTTINQNFKDYLAKMEEVREEYGLSKSQEVVLSEGGEQEQHVNSQNTSQSAPLERMMVAGNAELRGRPNNRADRNENSNTPNRRRERRSGRRNN